MLEKQEITYLIFITDESYPSSEYEASATQIDWVVFDLLNDYCLRKIK